MNDELEWSAHDQLMFISWPALGYEEYALSLSLSLSLNLNMYLHKLISGYVVNNTIVCV